MESKSYKNWIRTFDVGDPRRHKKGFTVYRVTSKVKSFSVNLMEHGIVVGLAGMSSKSEAPLSGSTLNFITFQLFPRSDPSGLTTLTVWKRYNDFKKLYTELEQIHRQLYLPGKFPEFPRGHLFNRFEYEVIEERKAAALSLLQFAATHVQLFTAKIFNKFFEVSDA